jgi:hypothetical protein
LYSDHLNLRDGTLTHVHRDGPDEHNGDERQYDIAREGLSNGGRNVAVDPELGKIGSGHGTTVLREGQF